MAASLVVEMSSEEAKLFRGLQRVIDQQKKLSDATDQVARKGKQAGQQMEQSFGGEQVQSIMRYATSFVSMSTAVSYLHQVFRDLNQETQEAGKNLERVVSLEKSLLQISQTPADLKKYQGEVDRLVRAGQSPEAANRIVRDAAAQNFMGEIPDIVRNKSIVDPTAMSDLYGGLSEAFFGQISPKEMSAVVLAASKTTDFGETAGAVMRAGEGLSSLEGTTPEQVAAAVATLADQFGGKRSGTLLSTMGQTIGRHEEFRGQDFSQALETLAGMDPAERQQFLGPKVDAAFRHLAANRDKMAGYTQEFAQERAWAGTEQGIFNRRRGLLTKEQRTIELADELESDVTQDKASDEGLEVHERRLWRGALEKFYRGQGFSKVDTFAKMREYDFVVNPWNPLGTNPQAAAEYRMQQGAGGTPQAGGAANAQYMADRQKGLEEATRLTNEILERIEGKLGGPASQLNHGGEAGQ